MSQFKAFVSQNEVDETRRKKQEGAHSTSTAAWPSLHLCRWPMVVFTFVIFIFTLIAVFINFFGHSTLSSPLGLRGGFAEWEKTRKEDQPLGEFNI